MTSVVMHCVAAQHPCPKRDNVLFPQNAAYTICFCSVGVRVVGWLMTSVVARCVAAEHLAAGALC